MSETATAVGDKINWTRTAPTDVPSLVEIDALLAPWLGARRVVGARLFKGGLSNRNIALTVDGAPESCVLRFFDRDPSSCAREVDVLQRLRGEVPVPDVLYADAAPADGPPFAVLSTVTGIPVFQLRQSGDAQALAEAVYDAGCVLGRLRAHHGPATPFTTIEAIVEMLVATPIVRQRVGARRTDALIGFVRTMQPRVSEMGAPASLVHGDYNSQNVLVARSPRGWRVSGVLDWEFALDASPYVDVGNFLRYHRASRPRYEPHFSRGLRDGGVELPHDWLTLARFFDVPALCELLARPHVPDEVVAELNLLLDETLENHYER